eukprot:1143508-Pelagomonas_calceolata.AAC.6
MPCRGPCSARACVRIKAINLLIICYLGHHVRLAGGSQPDIECLTVSYAVWHVLKWQLADPKEMNAQKCYMLSKPICKGGRMIISKYRKPKGYTMRLQER